MTPLDPQRMSPDRELESLNHELARFLRTDPAPLAGGADSSLADDLVIWGVLGGKDVGKSTLINVLAGNDISVDRDEVGRGTEAPIVYVHERSREAAGKRLGAHFKNCPAVYSEHHTDAIRNVVLVDLPDFDSEFHEHLDTVRHLAPLLDRIIWVLTPRKIGDRAWAELLPRVVKDVHNVHLVLNKLDELLSDNDPFERQDRGKKNGDAADRFWAIQHRWVEQMTGPVGFARDADRRFLVAAAFPNEKRFVDRVGQVWDDAAWEKYSKDRPSVSRIASLATRDLQRLRHRVLSPIEPDEAQAIKMANREREVVVNRGRMIEHFELERTLEQVAAACDPAYSHEVLQAAFDPVFRDWVESGIQARQRSDAELADLLLDKRVNQWPLLRLAYWPFGWLSRALGRRLGVPDLHASTADSGALLNIPGPSLTGRIEQVRCRLLSDHASVAVRLNWESKLPPGSRLEPGVRSGLVGLPQRIDEDLLARIHEATRPPSLIRKLGLFLVCLWFPLLQPLLAGALEMMIEPDRWSLLQGAYRIVSATSAVHVLVGVSMAIGVMIALVAAMSIRAVRAVRHARADQPEVVSESVDLELTQSVLQPFVRPIEADHRKLQALLRRLSA